ncbi:hypothetical protein ACET3Z_017428 [Daucus carota]
MLKLKEWDFPNSGAATANVNAWSGAAMFTLLLGAFIADSYLALSMIIVASFLYVLVNNNYMSKKSQCVELNLSLLARSKHPRGGGLEESQMFNILFLRHQWRVTRLIWLMVLMAEFASEHQSMLEGVRKAFYATEDSFTSIVREQWPIQPQLAAVGSCCLVGVICNGNLYIANLGDSCAVLGRLVKATGEVLAIQLSAEHNTCIESVLIEGTWRFQLVFKVERNSHLPYFPVEAANLLVVVLQYQA